MNYELPIVAHRLHRGIFYLRQPSAFGAEAGKPGSWEAGMKK